MSVWKPTRLCRLLRWFEFQFLLLMDLNMPVMDGIEATRRISQAFPGIRVIVLTVFEETEKIFESILAGATGYLLKDAKPGQIAGALEEAMEGGAPMSPVIAMKSLELIAKGETYQQMADKIFVSPKTVRKHIENIYRKMQVHNKVQAIRLGHKHKLFSILF